jgi:hypothetical protein
MQNSGVDLGALNTLIDKMAELGEAPTFTAHHSAASRQFRS